MKEKQNEDAGLVGKINMNLPSNPNVESLAKTFGLDLPKYYLKVTDYDFHDGSIRIKKMELLDSKGIFLRFVDNEKVICYMNKYPVAFEVK
jgi:hypothetical protein